MGEMIYIRKLFTQDLRDGKQIAFPKEPAEKFFNFKYWVGEIQPRQITFIFKPRDPGLSGFAGRVISTRLYAAGTKEARMDGEVKAFLRDELHAKVNDYVEFRRSNDSSYTFDFISQESVRASLYENFCDVHGFHTLVMAHIEELPLITHQINLPCQLVIYGAPGTGKSWRLKRDTAGCEVIRTTFHPDSDYSTFVGAYKPSMSDDAGRVEVYKGSGASKVLDATHEIKKGISYEFIPQAFIKAYVLAWKKMNDAPNGEDGKPNPEPVFLVIEEINRGNCAQIFGDIFQLLDRNDAGYSEYPIDADEDLKKFLSRPDDKGGLGGLDADAISTKFGVEKKEVELIRDGRHLMLPPNLLIRATMNTSDQSLFPIDSAFKRRWDWEYVPITEGNDKDGNPLGWKIAFDVPKKVEGAPDSTEEFEYDWWEFVKRVNEVIGDTTHSEDKKLGYFFVKPMEEEVGGGKKKVISAKRFLEKVIFISGMMCSRTTVLTRYLPRTASRLHSINSLTAKQGLSMSC